MSCSIDYRCSSDLALLWLWCRPATAVPVQPLAWEHPYAMGAALKKKITCTPNVHCSTIYNSQDMEATKMSINRGMDQDVIHIHDGILFNPKKEWNNAIFRNMDGPQDYHTKWNKYNRERQISYDITYIWGLIKNDTKEFILKIETNSQISKPILWLP